MEISDKKIKNLIKDKNGKIYRAAARLFVEIERLGEYDSKGNLAFFKTMPSDRCIASMRNEIEALNQQFHELNAIRNLIK